MADKSFADALNEQIANEFAASQQYVAAAVYYDAETLPRLAAFFYRQALEEREHAMMMIQYLLDVGEEVHIPDIKSVETTYADGSEPVKMALEQEKRVSDEIFSLFELARDLKDYRAEQFLQWFVKEQVEEVALMGDLLNVVERSKENLLLAEDYIARESLGEEGSDPTAPPGADQPSQPARLRIVLMRRNSAMSSRSAAGAGAGKKRAGSGDSATPSSRALTR
jgi:ferritin